MANNLLSGAANWGGLFGAPSVSDIGGLFGNQPRPNYPPVDLMSQIPGSPPQNLTPVPVAQRPRTTYEAAEQYIPPELRSLIPSRPGVFRSPQRTALAGAEVFGPQADVLAMKTSAANTMRSLLDTSLPWSERAKGGLLGSAYTLAAIPMMALPGTIAWHGTANRYAPEPGYPHGRPDLKYMGTGEGHQVKGKGHYAGGAKGTGEQYRDVLGGTDIIYKGRTLPEGHPQTWPKEFDSGNSLSRSFEDRVARRLSQQPGYNYETIRQEELATLLNPNRRWTPRQQGEVDSWVKAWQEVDFSKIETRPKAGSALYKYDIPDADTAKFLDYDASLDAQPQNVKDAIKKLGFWPEGGSVRGVKYPTNLVDKLRGGDVLQRMHYEWGKEHTARTLQREGVPGNRFKDQLSRPLKEGDAEEITYNYVTWDQDVLNRTKILEIDDQPVSSLLADVPASARAPASDVTVPLHKQGLLWTPMEGGSKAIHGGEITKTVPLVHPSEMSARIIPTGDLLPRNIVSPEDLQGSILVPAIGDRTRAGGLLTHINEAQLANPVVLQGGPDFMRGGAAQIDDVNWASGPSQIATLAEQAQELAPAGRDINFVYTAGGGRNADFSHHMSDAVLEQIPAAKITKTNKRRFDRVIKKIDPNWPGIDDPGVGQYLQSASGDTRKIFLETAALKRWQDAGFPDFPSTRFAITEPELLGVPSGSSGYAISRMDPTGRVVTDPKIPHQTYPVQLGGRGYVGGLLDPVPREVMFPDFYAARRAAGTPPQADDYSFLRSGNISQSADQQWLDNVMQYLERARRVR